MREALFYENVITFHVQQKFYICSLIYKFTFNVFCLKKKYKNNEKNHLFDCFFLPLQT